FAREVLMPIPRKSQRHSVPLAKRAVWRMVTAGLLLAVLAQPGLAPASAAPTPLVPEAAVAPRSAAFLCPLVVTTPSDAGPGSLRQAVACAAPGQTVTFSDTLASASINLTT